MTSDLTIVLADANPINILLDAGVSNNYVNADTPFYLDGSGGTTYLLFVSATDTLQLWKSGVLVSEW